MSNTNPFDDIEDMMIHARELAQMATEMVEVLIGSQPRMEGDCQALNAGGGRLGILAGRASNVTGGLIEAKRDISRFFDMTCPGKAEAALDSSTINSPPQSRTDWQGDYIRAQLRQSVR